MPPGKESVAVVLEAKNIPAIETAKTKINKKNSIFRVKIKSMSKLDARYLVIIPQENLSNFAGAVDNFYAYRIKCFSVYFTRAEFFNVFHVDHGPVPFVFVKTVLRIFFVVFLHNSVACNLSYNRSSRN